LSYTGNAFVNDLRLFLPGSVFPTTNSASYEALPVSPILLCSSLPLSYACLATLRVDFFNYGEPFLYKHLVASLRHIRRSHPETGIAISTDGLQVREDVERAIVTEKLLDWITFSVDGCDEESYRKYRIRGAFETAFANLVRFHRRAAGSGIRVTWQYVVFRWNDSDEQFRRAIAMAEREGIQIHFDFAHTWGRSRRRPDSIRYLTPFLKPFTALPGEPRQDGW